MLEKWNAGEEGVDELHEDVLEPESGGWNAGTELAGRMPLSVTSKFWFSTVLRGTLGDADEECTEITRVSDGNATVISSDQMFTEYVWYKILILYHIKYQESMPAKNKCVTYDIRIFINYEKRCFFFIYVLYVTNTIMLTNAY